MDEKIRKLTVEAIENEFQELKSLETGSDEKAATISNLTKLHELMIEEAKVEQAEIGQKKEEEFREQQLKSEAKSRRNNIILQVGGWVGTALLVAFAYKFEEQGVVKSAVTRTLIPKMFLKTK